MAAVLGAFYCGDELLRPELTLERARELRYLIFFHFGLSLASLLGAGAVVYLHLRDTAYSYLIVSYSEKALGIAPPGVELPSHRCFYSSLSTLRQRELPPADRPILVFPMMMQSGYTSSERLEREIREAYTAQRMDASRLELIMQPVLGASPWLARLIADEIRASLRDGDAILVVAHDTAPSLSSAPEPELLCQRLRKYFANHEVVLTRFEEHEQGTSAPLATMDAQRVHILPFLMSEGYHTQHDLPTQAQADAYGMQLLFHPVVGDLMRRRD